MCVREREGGRKPPEVNVGGREEIKISKKGEKKVRKKEREKNKESRMNKGT